MGSGLARTEPVAHLQPPGGRDRPRQRAHRDWRPPADARPAGGSLLPAAERRRRVRGFPLLRRQQQVQRPADRSAAHRAAVQRRLHPIEGPRNPVPLDRRQGSGGAELARHRAPGARCLPRRDQRHRARAGPAPGARVEPDRAEGHRSRLRGRHAHRGRCAERAQDAGAGADGLLGQPLRLHRQRAAAAPCGRHSRPPAADGNQQLADRAAPTSPPVATPET